GHDLLAAVVDGVPVVGAVLRRAEAAQVVALAGQLGLDDLGAELRHEGAAERPGDDLGELEHADAGQREAGVGHGGPAALWHRARRAVSRAGFARGAGMRHGCDGRARSPGELRPRAAGYTEIDVGRRPRGTAIR